MNSKTSEILAPYFVKRTDIDGFMTDCNRRTSRLRKTLHSLTFCCSFKYKKELSMNENEKSVEEKCCCMTSEERKVVTKLELRNFFNILRENIKKGKGKKKKKRISLIRKNGDNFLSKKHKTGFIYSNQNFPTIIPETESLLNVAPFLTTRTVLLGPPKADDLKKKCLIIDLDETLVHSSFQMTENVDLCVDVEFAGTVHRAYVRKRPYIDIFLQKMSSLFECVMFTASLAEYADQVTTLLDKWQVFRWRLFRDSCTFYEGNYIKDLGLLGRPIDQVVILDNSPSSYTFHPNNAVHINSWFGNSKDTSLLDLIPFFKRLAQAPSVSYFLSTVKPILQIPVSENLISTLSFNSKIFDPAYSVTSTVSDSNSESNSSTKPKLIIANSGVIQLPFSRSLGLQYIPFTKSTLKHPTNCNLIYTPSCHSEEPEKVSAKQVSKTIFASTSLITKTDIKVPKINSDHHKKLDVKKNKTKTKSVNPPVPSLPYSSHVIMLNTPRYPTQYHIVPSNLKSDSVNKLPKHTYFPF